MTKKVLTILNKVNVRYNYNSVHNILEFYKILVQVPFITSKTELAERPLSLSATWLSRGKPRAPVKETALLT